jgi:hypothetical protein
MKEDSKSFPTTMPKCYHTNCRLGKARPDPQNGEKYGNTYPISPYIGTPLALVKDKSYKRGVSLVTLGGNEMESAVMEGGAPIGQDKKWKMEWK